MNILHIPFGYFPDICGGTEVYVSALSRELSKLGHHVSVAAPGEKLEQYGYEGIQVFRYPVNGDIEDSSRNGKGDPQAAAYVGEILDRIEPDIVHLHALTSGVSLLVLKEANKRNIKTVLTYHTPTVSCARGTLLHLGKTVCDGVMDLQRCTACSLHGLGLNISLAHIVSNMPVWAGKAVSRTGVQSSWLTAVRRREMIGLRQDAVRQVFTKVDHVVSLCDWTEQLLQLNGLAIGKTSVVRHALPHEARDNLPEQIAVPSAFSKDQPLRLIYMGRISPEKGVDVVLKAVAHLPAELPVVLDIYGLQQDDGSYVQEVNRTADRHHRINLLEPVPPEDVTALMRQYHLLLVPSQWLETGPFVVLESLFSRTLIIGSRLGGIEERIREGIDGALVTDYTCPEAWADRLQRFHDSPQEIAAMRANIVPPAGFDEVAKAHLQIYRQLEKEQE